MVSLASNGNRGSTWCGADPGTIIYPDVSSCITVTCVVGGRLAGAQFFNTGLIGVSGSVIPPPMARMPPRWRD